MKIDRSILLHERAKGLIPGGVMSPVRAFLSVKATPLYIERAKGPYIFDVDGNSYIDYIASWGAIILGHAPEELVRTVTEALEAGTSFGLCHPYEIELASLIREAFPSMELLRLTSSGTEAVMSAIRLARAYTGRRGIIKLRGCYHGHMDSLLVRAGSGLATYGLPASSGVTEDTTRYTFLADFNDLSSIERIIEEHSKEIACLILEPIMGNMGVICPQPSFLKGTERVCREHGILLIFDEVITGFRVTYGGAQHLFGVTPDLTCLGKIVGGGFPLAAFGGKREIMERLAPLGDVYQAGTLSGNPVGVRAGLYVLRYLREHREIYRRMEEQVRLMEEEVKGIARRFRIPYNVNGTTGMFTGFFAEGKVANYEEALRARTDLYERFFKLMLEEGVLFAPSQFEAAFLTASHTSEEIEKTLRAFHRVFERMGN
jgi:glutamate-1-semialdehyde 2,1-aminomutase